MSGTSYEVFGRLLIYYAEMGTCYIRLEHLLPILKSLGIIYKGIATALQSFLQLLLNSIIQMSGMVSLLWQHHSLLWQHHTLLWQHHSLLWQHHSLL